MLQRQNNGCLMTHRGLTYGFVQWKCSSGPLDPSSDVIELSYGQLLQINEPHFCSAGAAGFPGGAPGGMPGLGEFLKDPELLNAMKVIWAHNISARRPHMGSGKGKKKRKSGVLTDNNNDSISNSCQQSGNHPQQTVTLSHIKSFLNPSVSLLRCPAQCHLSQCWVVSASGH